MKRAKWWRVRQRSSRVWVLLGVCIGWLSLSGAVRAATPLPSSQELETVQAALARGAFSEAIDRLEQWSDQGAVHPDLSFDRGVAYLGRAESTASRRADLGQAAAAFEEAVSLDPSDEEATLALERIRQLISERRAKQQNAGVVARPRLLRALLGLIDENVWAGTAAVGSLLLTLGLAGRLLMRSHQVRLGSSIAGVMGLLFLLLGGGMALAGSRLRARFVPAVVIVEEARLHDDAGRPFSNSQGLSTLGETGDRVPEGSLVYIAASRGSLVRVEWGDSEAWLNAAELRRLARP
jgi:tetratricopeptide (TPR) repeat protein